MAVCVAVCIKNVYKTFKQFLDQPQLGMLKVESLFGHADDPSGMQDNQINVVSRGKCPQLG